MRLAILGLGFVCFSLFAFAALAVLAALLIR